MSVEISAEKFAQYTEAGDSAWNGVEGRVFDFFLKTRFHDHFNFIFRWPDYQMILGIRTKHDSWIPEDFRALDLGTGTGHIPNSLIEFGVKPENIVGIDNNSAMLGCFAFPDKVRQLCGDIKEVDKIVSKNLPGFGNFDLVTANMVFHYFKYQEYVNILKK